MGSLTGTPKQPVVAVKKPAESPPPQSVAQESLALDPEPAQGKDEFVLKSDDQVQVVAHAMVGISNKLFIRGDEPWLSWDQGIPMNLIGIGEFAWTGGDVNEPIEVSIRLNDEIEALGGTLKLAPGKITEVSPKFPS